MDREFNLSEKVVQVRGDFTNWIKGYREDDVKEFIKRLKEEIIENKDDDYYIEMGVNEFKEIINKLAGDKLI